MGIKEIKIELFKENDTMHSRVDGDAFEQFSYPSPYWEAYTKDYRLDSQYLAPFGERLFFMLFSHSHRKKNIHDAIESIVATDELIFTIVSSDPDMLAIPWELLNSNGTPEGFLLKKQNIYMIRRTKDFFCTTEPAASVFDILLVLSLPLSTFEESPLDPFKQFSKLYNALGTGNRKYTRIDVLENASFTSIRKALCSKKYHIIHFSGHGTADTLVLEAEDDFTKPEMISGDKIRELFSGTTARLVILDACFSAESRYGASVVSRTGDVPLIIANQSSVSDSYARKETETSIKTFLLKTHFRTGY
jgi:hypothetical protein